MSEAETDALREAMIEAHLIARGISEPAVLDAFAAVPRERFVRTQDAPYAYEDTALPFGGPGETISQPYVVAWMAELAGIGAATKLLEIGCGSGYAAAIFAAAGARVTSLERNGALARAARVRLVDWDVVVHEADGWFGWPDGAPFDAIVISAAVATVSDAWLAQLAPGGRLVVPVGTDDQRMRTFRDGTWTDHGAVSFVALTRGISARS